MNVLVQNGIKKLTEMTARTFLLANQGVYTGTRTIGQNKIVALKDNIDRLRKSINESENMNCTYTEIENLFINNISIAYKEFMVQHQNFNGEVFFYYYSKSRYKFWNKCISTSLRNEKNIQQKLLLKFAEHQEKHLKLKIPNGYMKEKKLLHHLMPTIMYFMTKMVDCTKDLVAISIL